MPNPDPNPKPKPNPNPNPNPNQVRLVKGAGGIGLKVDRTNVVIGLTAGGAAMCVENKARDRA